MKEDGGEKEMLGAFGASCHNHPLSWRQVELTGAADDAVESDDECRGYVHCKRIVSKTQVSVS